MSGVHVCVTPECVCGVPVNECCELTLQTTAPVCAAESETCVGTHLAVEDVTLECEAVSQYAGKVECVEGQHITLECVQPAVCGSPERGMSGDRGNRLEVQGEIEMPPGQNLTQGTKTIMDSSAWVLAELEVLHPGAGF